MTPFVEHSVIHLTLYVQRHVYHRTAIDGGMRSIVKLGSLVKEEPLCAICGTEVPCDVCRSGTIVEVCLVLLEYRHDNTSVAFAVEVIILTYLIFFLILVVLLYMLRIESWYIHPVFKSVTIKALVILFLVESVVGRDIQSCGGTSYREFVFLILASIFVLFLFCSRDVRYHYLVQVIYAEETFAKLLIVSLVDEQTCLWQPVRHSTAVT